MLLRLFLFSFLFTNSLYALDATMEIIKKKSTLPSISVVVSSDTTFKKNITNGIKSLIQKDLEVSGHFLNNEITIEHNFNSMPSYVKLTENGIDLYLLLKVISDNKKGLTIYAKLYDVNMKSLVSSKTYSTTLIARYPFLSHKISIDINKHLDAPSIQWMDRFVIFSRYLDSKTSEIVVSDYTLSYQKVVVKGGLNIFPKWANDEQKEFYYTSYNYMKPTIIKQNLYTKKSKKLLSSDGMIVCSDVSKNGDKLILTMAPNGQPDIYIYDINSKIKTRLTRYSGIDVGGNFVENDTKIVFVSDRLKYPNIFSKYINSKGVERLLYHGKNNSQSTTFNDYIVYTSRETDNEFGDNVFNLYLISTNSDYVRRLTTNGRNQFPKFSADGESILFTKKSGQKSYLGIIRVNYNKSFLFPLKSGSLQSIDW
ncbi:MAG: Tol-Pal system protein TolB [Campylobacterota bacterium]|nr:Tol-Pal system protein TolB [Campylobacterota bacterium]